MEEELNDQTLDKQACLAKEEISPSQKTQSIKQQLENAESVSQVNPEFIKMYYEHHYDRVTRLEEQGLIITNVAMTFSIVVFTFGFDDIQNINFFTAILLPLIMIFVNGFAVAYLIASRNWISSHRQRAERVLEIYAEGIYLLDRSIFNSRDNVFMGRRKAQIFIHYLLMSAAFLPMLIYTRTLVFP